MNLLTFENELSKCKRWPVFDEKYWYCTDTSKRLCSVCNQLKIFAKRNSFRTVDLRNALREGHISSSLSEDCFVEVMKAFVRGSSVPHANKALQASARAERMSKRNRS